MGKTTRTRLEFLKGKVSIGRATVKEEQELNELHKSHMIELAERPVFAEAKKYPLRPKFKIPR